MKRKDEDDDIINNWILLNEREMTPLGNIIKVELLSIEVCTGCIQRIKYIKMCFNTYKYALY